jgi:WD40 repeat protein/class 3 adenylate cyclase/DNA-binding SARP family transcriptional activator
MRFLVLGPLEVEDRNGTVPLGGRKQRLVLAHLVRRANELVTSNVLIDDIWGEEPPDAVRSSLQGYVSNLRKLIGADRLEGRLGGYRLRVEPGELDAREFERLAIEARGDLEADPGASADTLRAALGLWRGPAFGDLGDELSLHGEVARLEEARRLAIEDRFAAELDLGRHASLVGELEALTLEDPLRERPWGLWMLSLYRSGRQADALAAFRQAQAIFADQLGIDPSRSLQELHERILAQDPALSVLAPGGPRSATTETDPSLRIFLIADIRGYTSFTEARGDEAAAALATRFAELARPTVETNAGSVVELRGDEVLAVFTSARQAIRAAADLQIRFAEETVIDPSMPLPVGIGLDAGEAVAVGGGFRGGALNLAARLCSSAAPGEILASQEVVHLARHVEGISQLDRGGVRFKGLDDPVRVIRLRPEGWDPTRDLAFQRALGPDAARLTPVGADLPNPYKGLLPFEESDAVAFFGREALTRELVARLADARFLAVIGPSGSGKSSVVRAGLLPALRMGALPGSDRWTVVEMMPGAHPMIELESALLKISDDPPTSLLELLDSDELGMLRAIKRVTTADAPEVLLFIDQLEEVFTLVEDEDRRARFLAGLDLVVREPHVRIRFVTTLRADFYDRPLMYPGFADLMRSHIEPVVPLSPDELERAIAEPARRVGVELEPGLLAEMLAEASNEPGALPLLQYALTELFERREGNTLTLDAYRAIGGMAGAISGRADDLYAASDDAAKEAARQLFLRLLTLGEGTEDIRRRVTRAEIGSIDVDQGTMNGVLDRFGASRLLSFDRDARTYEPTVDVAHEALLRSWPRLRGWIQAARDDVRMSRRLGTAATGWVDAGRDPSFLLRGGQLAQFESWGAHTIVAPTAEERSYLDASLEDRDAAQVAEEARAAREVAMERRSVRRLRAVVAVVTTAAVVAGLLAVIASNQRSEAERQTGIATARELAAAALSNLDADPELSILLALQAVETTRSVDGSVLREAEEALHRAVGSSRLMRSLDDPSSGSVSFSPDGSLVATAQRVPSPATSPVADPVVWDTASGEKVLTLVGGHSDNVNDIQFGPDGSILATAGEDGTVVIWDANTGEEIRSIRADQGGERGGAFNVDISPDGSRVVVTTSPGDEATIGVFDVGTGQRSLAISLPHTVCGIDFSPDGRSLLGGECFGTGIPTAHLWSATTGAELRTFGDHGGYVVTGVAFSPDGRRVVTVGYDGVGRVWDAETGGLIASLSGHSGGVETADFSPDGSLIATGSNDGTARVWDARTGREVLVLSGTGARVGEVEFSPDGMTLVTGGFGGTSRVWDIRPEGNREELTLAVRGAAFQVAYSLDGTMLVGTDSSGFRLWDAASGTPLQRFPKGSGLARFVPESDRVLVSLDPPIVRDQLSGELRVTKPTGAHHSMEYSPDGRVIATGDEDGRVTLWDASSGEEIVVLDPPSDRQPSVDGLAFSPDGSILVSASTDGTAKVWDLDTDRLVRTLRGHDDRLSNAAFSPDGSLIATSSGDGTARIWDLDGNQLEVLAGHQGAVQDVAFSPDGRRIATAGQDQTVRLWDVANGREILLLRGQTASLSVAFSPDGTHLASASYDGTIRVYVLPVDDLITLAESRLTRTWTQEECRQYLRLETCPAA